MNYIFLLSFLILSASAVSHALPALNDYAKFDVTIADGKSEIKLEEEMKLIEFDEPTKIFLNHCFKFLFCAVYSQ